MRFAAVIFSLLALPALAAGPVVVVDGDTFRLGEVTIRIENIDAPETRNAQCEAERRLGQRAAGRLGELLGSGPIALSRNPADRRDQDRYGRKLRRVAVNGVDAGETLIREGLARRWTGRRAPWC